MIRFDELKIGAKFAFWADEYGYSKHLEWFTCIKETNQNNDAAAQEPLL